MLYDVPLDLAWLSDGGALALGRDGEGDDGGRDDGGEVVGLAGEVPEASVLREPSRELVTPGGVWLSVHPRHDGARVRAGRSVRAADLGLEVVSPRALVPHGAPAPPPPPATAGSLSPGDEGDLRGARVRVRGGVARASEVGVWVEHLLEHDDGELAWLVEDEGAFSLARPLEASAIVACARHLADAAPEAAELVAAWGDLPFDAAPGERSVVRTAPWGDGTLVVEERGPEGRAFARVEPVPTIDVQRAFPRRRLPPAPLGQRPRS